MAEETKSERLDRELNELLQELRVVLPGIQVMFAFLLTVPFAQGFSKVTAGQREVFFVAFLLTTLASILLIAPSVQHRMLWRQHDKERLLRRSNRLALTGMAILAIAVDAVVYLVTDVVHDTSTAIVAAAVAGIAFAGIWYAWPLARSRQKSGASA